MKIGYYLKKYFTIALLACFALGIYAQDRSERSTKSTYGQGGINTDSLKQARKLRADSIAAYRAYRRSKAYNDSMDAVRQQRRDSIKAVRKKYNDSLKAVRIRYNDSVRKVRDDRRDSMNAAIAVQRAARKKTMDSLKAIRREILDSLAVIRAYKRSDRYKDSVATIRRQRLDSIKAVRKSFNDSVRQVRRKRIDSMRAVRKVYLDSMRSSLDSIKQVRMAVRDSIKRIRQARADSLEIAREKREIEREKKREEKKKKDQLAFEFKIQKERDAYTNEDLRKKPWGFLRRNYHNITTRYNYFFNANKKMTLVEDEIFLNKKDNLDALIDLHPFDPNRDSASVAQDMDSLIKRTSIGIQIHDPRGKWQDDMYFVLGKAYYLKGDYSNAIASFQYIIANAVKEERAQKKKKGATIDFIKKEKAGALHHNSKKNEAILWLAKMYVHTGAYNKAELLLDMAANSKNLPSHLKGELFQNYALVNMAINNKKEAVAYIDSLAQDKEADKRMRIRAGYLSGQLYAQNQDWQNAAKSYKKVVALNPTLNFEVNAKINTALALLNTEGTSFDVQSKSLNRMTRESKYNKYYDKIYYALGGAYEKEKKTEKAIESYKSSIEKAANNQAQKGLSYYALAGQYYLSKDYLASKDAYDSAVAFLDSKEENRVELATQRSRGLQSISQPSIEIRTIDSVLHLAALPSRQRRAAVRKHIRALKSLEKAAAATATPVMATPVPSGGNWYFTNTSQLEKGKADFKQKWGSRKLEDNWRTSSSNFNNDTEAEDAAIALEQIREGKYDIDALMLQIPDDPNVIDSLKKRLPILQLSLAKAFNEAGDEEAAINNYKAVIANKSSLAQLEEVYYDLYIIALNQNKQEEAATWKQLLVNNFPKGAYQKRISESANSKGKLSDLERSKASIMKHYDDTYKLLRDNKFREVIERADAAKGTYPSQISYFANKYKILKAMAFAGLEEYSDAEALLSEFLAINPNDSLADMARRIKEAISKKLLTQIPSTPSTANPVMNGGIQVKYIADLNAPHYVLINNPKIDGKFLALKSSLSSYNQANYAEQDLNTMLEVLGAANNMLLIRQFNNASDAKAYIAKVKGVPTLTQQYGGNPTFKYYIISKTNFDLLKNVGKNFNAYQSFYEQNY